MEPTPPFTSAHALLKTLAVNGIDRVFLVPGESYLGVLDALNDFPGIDVVTCRHEAGAGFMAIADARLTRRPSVAMVSRGPGASNAAIAVHTAEQDAVPLVLMVGQVPRSHLRRGAFQEIDYQAMFGRIAKRVIEPAQASELGLAARRALQVALSGTPGPVVVVLPEDIQQQAVADVREPVVALPERQPLPSDIDQVGAALGRAERPLIVAGDALGAPGGREALLRFAQAWHVPVVASFRRNDIFPNSHPLYAGELGLANPPEQIQAFDRCDLLLALGTRFGDITSQGYQFPTMPRPAQTVVHCHPDGAHLGRHFTADIPVECDPVALVRAALPGGAWQASPERNAWSSRLRLLREQHAQWPAEKSRPGVVSAAAIASALGKLIPPDTVVTFDAGSFAAPFYRHFTFDGPARMLAPIAGAMGFGVPAAVAAKMREPSRTVVCTVGDGGFLMTGNEMIAAVERKLKVVFLLFNNGGYGSIRIHQHREYPARRGHSGTRLFNPDFIEMARAFGLEAERVSDEREIEAALRHSLSRDGPCLIEFMTELGMVQPDSK